MVLWAVIRRICVYLYLINVLRTSSDNLASAHFTNSWAVHIPQVDEETVKEIARRHGMINLGQVGSLEGFYHFKHRAYPRRMKRETIAPTFKLSREFKVKWVEQQVVKKRVKRDISYPDPLWPQQWYLHNRENLNYDHNVLSVWKKLNIIGRGVSVSILDDGIEMDHPDLKANYDPDASYDYNSHDSDPSPRATYNNENRHGTRCAGEVAAVADNNICGIGVAYGAKVGGIRMLDGEVTDVVEANSLSYKPKHIDVYSSSWGPDDDGKTVDGPGPLAKAAFSNGIDKGRGGLGNIFVWASGNGGREQDNCNCDGYTNSIYTLSISSATERGTSPWYSEYCASTLASTFSSGGWNMRKIVTTDLHHQCTTQHTGTSASAPLASGILALALEANPKLTWRDMQHIVVRTSKPDKLKSNDWVTNGVGRRISHRFGYGLLDARALVDLAIIWPTAPEKHKCEEAKDMKPRPIPHSGSLVVEKDVVGCQGSKNSIQYLEHVEVVISLSFTRRGDLTIAIISPQGTKSTLLGKRLMDYSTDGFNDWAFMSTHSWGENPRGTWRLEVKNVGDVKNTGTLTSWQLRFHGTQDSPDIKYKSCSGECKNGCHGPSARDCVECANFKSNGVCVSQCEEHKYPDNVTKECRPCSNACEKCQGPGTNDCIMCTSSLYLKEGSCVVNCPDGWFISDNHTCERCDSNCLTCSKKAVLCSSCKKYQKLEMDRCVMNCKKNEFVSMERCWPCHPSCLSCNNDTAWSCTKCDFTLATRESVKQDLYLHRGMCVVQCPTGFYGESHQCLQCHSSCKYCRGPLKTECTTCKDGLVRADNGTGLCLDYCPSGSSHRISEDTCVQCGLNCSACDPDIPSQCTACPQGKFLWRGACLPAESCPRSTYPELNTSRCQFCHPSCDRCSDSPTICTACFGYSYLHNNKCNLVCPNGTFGMNNMCQFCKPECLTCFGANRNQCLTCVNGFKFFNNTCVKQCPKGMFVDNNGRCQRCSLTCKECIGEKTNCTSCVDGFIKVNGTCKSLCDDGTFYNVTSAGQTSRNKSRDHCSRCHVSCLTCTGPMKYDCLRCKGVKFRNPETALCSLNCPKKGFYEGLSSSLCEDCPSECESCINPLQCSKCIYGLFLHNGRCVSRCPEGFYADNRTTAGVCLPCNRKCESCAGTATSCTQCSSSLILYNHQCLLHCPSGMFFSNDFKSCLPCHNSCLTCVGVSSSRCTLCKSGLVFFRGQCRSHCPIRYYHNNASHSCEPCGNYCHRCSKGSDPSTCEECISPFVLQHNTCVRTCSAGYVLDHRQGMCVRCHATCATCMGPTENECLTCKNDRWSLEGSVCKKSCGKGWYKDPLTSLCESCHPLCKTCSGPGEAACTSCVAKLSLLKGRCVSSCKEDQYRGKNGKCYMCSSSCKSCKDANIHDCLSCNDGEKLYNYTCVKTCPYGSYEKKSNDILECSKCHPSCVTCVGAGPNTCTSCRADLYFEGTKCVKQCSMFHMIEEDTRKCKLCTNDCPVDMNITDRRWLLGRTNDNRIAHIVYTNHEKKFIMISFATCGTFLFLFALFGLFKSRSRRGYTVVENTSASNVESQRQTLNNNVPRVYIRDEQSQREREAMLDDNDI